MSAAAGAGIGAGLGLVTTAFQINADNKAIAEQQKELARQNRARQIILTTQQEVAKIDAREAIAGVQGVGAQNIRDVEVQGKTAEGQVTANRASGITGGNVIARNLMAIAQAETKAKGKAKAGEEQQVSTVFDNLRQVNAQLQSAKIDSRNRALSAINGLETKKLEGFDRVLKIATGALGMASMGASLGGALSANAAVTPATSGVGASTQTSGVL